MEWFAPFLPVTVIAAVALFVLREVVDGFKRWRADVRKGRAFRTLLARECELNHWVYKRLRDTLLAIQENFQKGTAVEYFIKRPNSGDTIFRQVGKDGRLQGEWPLPDVRIDLMGKIMLDVAILDNSLFTYLESAYDSSINMRHVRTSLIRFIESEEEDHKMFFPEFPEYGLGQLDGVLSDLDSLYKECTGEELRHIRVR